MNLPSELTSGDNSVFWFRRDLRSFDNRGLYEILQSHSNTIGLFIFDENILDELNPGDKRVKIIHQLVENLQSDFVNHGSSLIVIKGKPLEIFRNCNIKSLFFNRDYEPYARERDRSVKDILEAKATEVRDFKDHVIFEKDEILTGNDTPYTVYTPYSKNWLNTVTSDDLEEHSPNFANLLKLDQKSLLSMDELGFTTNEKIEFSTELDPEISKNYDTNRDYPALRTSRLGIALRFGAVSTRALIKQLKNSPTLRGELIWREFFQAVIWHYPDSAYENFRKKYDGVKWDYDEELFESWKNGKTGYPIVDAGMRELNETGFMHNRVRMITASFLVKHLLHHWVHGEAYFAEKLYDYELASNVGNWQWVAGTGCDAAPYFRVFNPESQMKKFDPELKYIRKWIPELDTPDYPDPIVEHSKARERAIDRYKRGLSN